MDLQLTGRKALVTGGTRGIGRAIVGALLEEGAEVAFCARNADAVPVCRSIAGSNSTARTALPARPAALQVLPPSALLNTPPPACGSSVQVEA